MLDRFMNEFIGYGSFDADLWFLGPEEAGCRSVDDLLKRIAAWVELGAEPVVDLFSFHKHIGVTHLFGEMPKIQRTWRRLIEMVLVSRGEMVTRGAIASFQATRLGRPGYGTLLGELLPLPKPSITSWPYAQLSGQLPFLVTRRTYRKAIEPARVELLRSMVQTHRPRTIVFYGATHHRAWEEVAGVTFVVDEDGYAYCEAMGNRYLLVRHPNARGLPQNYFAEAASRFLK